MGLSHALSESPLITAEPTPAQVNSRETWIDLTCTERNLSSSPAVKESQRRDASTTPPTSPLLVKPSARSLLKTRPPRPSSPSVKHAPTAVTTVAESRRLLMLELPKSEYLHTVERMCRMNLALCPKA